MRETEGGGRDGNRSDGQHRCCSNEERGKGGGDYGKPNGLEVVKPGQVREFFASLDVERVPGVGPVTASGLREMGIDTAGGLSEAGPVPP